MVVTCDGWQGSGVGVGQCNTLLVWLWQVGVTAELLLLWQLEGDRDQPTAPSPPFSPSSDGPVLVETHRHFSIKQKAHPHPFAVQRAGPFSLLGDEDHAAPLLLLLALPQPDLGVTHRHHQILGHAHAPAGVLEGEDSGWLWRQVPGCVCVRNRHNVQKWRYETFAPLRIIWTRFQQIYSLITWVQRQVSNTSDYDAHIQLIARYWGTTMTFFPADDPADVCIADLYSWVMWLIHQVQIKWNGQCHLSAWAFVGVPHSDPCSEEIEMIDWRMERSMERGRVDFLSSKSGCKHKDRP